MTTDNVMYQLRHQYSVAKAEAIHRGWSLSFRIRGKKHYATIKASQAPLMTSSYYEAFRAFRHKHMPHAQLTSQSSYSGFTVRLNPDA